MAVRLVKLLSIQLAEVNQNYVNLEKLTLVLLATSANFLSNSLDINAVESVEVG